MKTTALIPAAFTTELMDALWLHHHPSSDNYDQFCNLHKNERENRKISNEEFSL